jgi:hypothetical protein
LKTMIEGGNRASLDDVFTIDWVKYSGDVGGINCAFEYSKRGERYAVSLTHLKIDPEHPLADEVVTYQQRRIRLLKLQDRGGFAADLLANTTQLKRSKGGAGFGKK